ALAESSANSLDRAAITSLRIDVYTRLDQSSRAVAAALEYLEHLGGRWAPHPTEEDLRREYEGLLARLGDRPIEALIDLPSMSDPACLATLDVLIKLGPPAVCTDPNLMPLVGCRAV